VSEALKPCPFCGGVARFLEVEEEQNMGAVVVECIRCHCCTACVFPAKDDARPHASELWNRRTAGAPEAKP
jgi:Lar family restriction alleviation protein